MSWYKTALEEAGLGKKRQFSSPLTPKVPVPLQYGEGQQIPVPVPKHHG